VNNIHVIGIGYKPFEKKSRRIILDADVILTSTRLYEVFKEYEEFATVQERVVVINKIDETMEFIRDNFEKKAVVLLASGDPMFFGIGRKVLNEFGPDNIEMVPDLSSIQIAFSKIKEPWDDAFLMSLHGGPDPEKRRSLPYELKDIPSLLEKHPKIAILTDKENNPSAIASFLNSSLLTPNSSLLMFVCERLGYPDEKITSGNPEEISDKTFSDPNVVIILMGNSSLSSFPLIGNPSSNKDSGQAVMTETPAERSPARDLTISFGLTEGEIVHSQGLITKDEVRAVSIHKLRLPQKGVFWDIGAGSGSVSIEAARLHPGLKIYAIDRDKDQLVNIGKNKMTFGAANVAITSGEAPEILKDLPSPDRVFIGGSGGNLSGIVRRVKEKMCRGIIVINAVTLDTLNEAILLLENNGFEPEVSQISVSRSKILAGQRQMTALNPVFVIKGERK
jgi:precorrin-6Y C5,15-methyltransferase (decarboxylating)